MKILIADDNSKTRKLMRNILEPFGHLVVESENGLEAIRLYKLEMPDCVLMDYEMPGLNGISTTIAIRASYPEARILIVTMHDDDELRNAADKAGAERYLLKENLTELPGILESVRDN